MPIPDGMRRFNKVALNKVARRLAPWLPGLGVVIHRGRISGNEYRTPVNVFPRPGGRYVVALTYGPGTDWVKNVIAACGCELLTRGTHFELNAPRLFHDETRHEIRVVERKVLALLNVSDFLELRVVPDARSPQVGIETP
jgi:deazaflavin-dependent oxidoreductase (nitroreductase family)